MDQRNNGLFLKQQVIRDVGHQEGGRRFCWNTAPTTKGTTLSTRKSHRPVGPAERWSSNRCARNSWLARRLRQVHSSKKKIYKNLRNIFCLRLISVRLQRNRSYRPEGSSSSLRHGKKSKNTTEGNAVTPPPWKKRKKKGFFFSGWKSSARHFPW